MNKLSSIEGTLDLLRSAVKERGADYVYADHYDHVGYVGCQYAVTDKNGELTPACIVGVAVYTAEGPAGLSFLHRFEGISADYIDAGNSQTREVLTAAQQVQDSNGTWGMALLAAEEKARELIGLQEEAVEE